MMNIERPTKRRVLFEKFTAINKKIKYNGSKNLEHIYFIENCIFNFINEKSIEEIQVELREILFKKEWCNKCPAPLGQTIHHRLLMQMYISNEFREVCEEYIYKHQDEINEKQKEYLETWSDECC